MIFISIIKLLFLAEINKKKMKNPWQIDKLFKLRLGKCPKFAVFHSICSTKEQMLGFQH
jgi:hypothetical protein